MSKLTSPIAPTVCRMFTKISASGPGFGVWLAGRKQPPPCYNCCHRRLSTHKLQHIGAPLDAIQNSIDGASLAGLQALRRASQRQGARVYLVGGPVRDVFLGRTIKDLDFAVEGDTLSLARLLATEVGGRLVLHPQFGTASVDAGDARIDLATARCESYPQPGALPQVAPASIQEGPGQARFFG